MKCESNYDYQRRISQAMREAARRRAAAEKKERSADWDAIRKSLF
jgi:hypothetical protein